MRRLAMSIVAVLLAMPAYAADRTPLRVLFIGNSLTYVNDLPGLVAAFARAQPDGPAIETTSFVAPGGTLLEHWNDGDAASALRAQRIDVLVLQERGAVLGCTQSDIDRSARDCQDAIRAHRAFASLAQQRGARVLMIETWPVRGDGQDVQHAGARFVAGRIGATLVHAGDALQAQARATSRAATFPDGVHPSLSGSLTVAAQLYRAITGNPPTPSTLRLDVPRLSYAVAIDPHRPLETQLPPASAPVPIIDASALAPLLAMAARYR